jgi:septal ring factor EnvC (AmiA/AmiB activator)
MTRKSNLAHVRPAQWMPPLPVSPEQRVLRVLSKERDRATARISVIENLLADKERLAEQLTHIRDFAERVMEDVDVKSEELAQLKDTVSQQDTRIAQLESALKMLGEVESATIEPEMAVPEQAESTLPPQASSSPPARAEVHRFDKPFVPRPRAVEEEDDDSWLR